MQRLTSLLVLVAAGCSPPAFRPAGELRHGARAVVPWASLELTARRGVERAWIVPLRNPVEDVVVLEPPRLAGCGQCLSVRWDAARADGSVRVAPGGRAALALIYTGAPAPDDARFAVEIEVRDPSGPPVRIPGRVRLTGGAPVTSARLTLRVARGSLLPATIPWADANGWRPIRVDLRGERGEVIALLAGPLGTGPAELTLQPRRAWATYQTGTLTLQGPVGADQTVEMVWRAFGVPPFRARWLPTRGRGAGTLLVASGVDRPIAVRVRLLRDEDTVYERTVEVAPATRVHVVLDVPADAEEPWTVLVDARGFEYRQRIEVRP